MHNISIRYIKGVGPRKQDIFRQKAGVFTIRDLLYYFPFRYEDRTNFVKIKDLKENKFSVIQGKVRARNLKKMPYFLKNKKTKSVFEAIVEDSTGKVNCVWFNQAYLSGVVTVDRELIVYGKPTYHKGRLQLVSPKFEQCGNSGFLNVGKIVPIYRLPAGFSQRYMRKTISLTLKQHQRQLLDPIPFSVRKKENIANIAKSLEQIHFPDSWEEAKLARQRFIFEELFISQIMVYLRKARHRLQEGPSLEIDREIVLKIKKSLAFDLTLAQKKVINQILLDLKKSYPMHRLLQGDVGSGKTAVAVFPLLLLAAAGWQAAFMAPTSVLAHQHKHTIDRLLSEAPPPLSLLKNKVEIITSSLTAKKRSASLKRLIRGDSLIVVGTHSLIQKDLQFRKLGVVVIDEQHKFGVAQRALLPKKGQIPPNCLVMSATPIPRSLALSLYGDLDYSVIDQLPQGRLRPETILINEGQRDRAYNLIKSKLKENRQVYIVYPLIDTSDDLEEKSLKQMYEKIKAKFSEYSLGVLHGRLKHEEKLRVIQNFRKQKIDILIATNVVEVGLDVSNATTMMVESPQKFGLSQLHQLRGRIQRSREKPTFILIYKENISQEAKERLEAVKRESDGFKIAEEDLRMRGPGEFFGQLQHGLPQLKVADPLRDLEILKLARSHAREIIRNDPYLDKTANKPIRESLRFIQFQAESNLNLVSEHRLK